MIFHSQLVDDDMGDHNADKKSAASSAADEDSDTESRHHHDLSPREVSPDAETTTPTTQASNPTENKVSTPYCYQLPASTRRVGHYKTE